MKASGKTPLQQFARTVHVIKDSHAQLKAGTTKAGTKNKKQEKKPELKQIWSSFVRSFSRGKG